MADKIFNFLINCFSNMNDRGVDEINNFKGNITSDEIVEWLEDYGLSTSTINYFISEWESYFNEAKTRGYNERCLRETYSPI